MDDALATTPSTSRRWPRFVLAVWLVAGLAMAVHAALRPHQRTLFRIYVTAAESWVETDDLYAPRMNVGDFYRYSPTFAVLLTPFSLLSPPVGNAAWKLTNAGVFALGLWFWCRHVLLTRPTSNLTASVFFVTFLAVLGNLLNGQANLLMTGFVLLGFAAIARERWWLAAGFLAAATLIKVFPLALAMVLAVLFWRTFPLRFVAALAVGLAIPFATQHPEYVLRQTGEWLHHVTGSLEFNRDRLRSLDKFFELAGWRIERQAFQAITAAAGSVVLAVGLLAQRLRLPRGEVLFLVGAWFSTWVLLYSPSSENATFTILGPFLGRAIVDAFRRRGAWVARVWLIASLYLMCTAGGDAGILTKSLFTKYPASTLGGILFQLWLVADLPRRCIALASGVASTSTPQATNAGEPVTSHQAA